MPIPKILQHDARALARAMLMATAVFFIVFFSFYGTQQYFEIKEYNANLEQQISERVTYLAPPLGRFDFDLAVALSSEIDTTPGILGIKVEEQYGYEIYNTITEDVSGKRQNYELFKPNGETEGKVLVVFEFKDLIAELPGLIARSLGMTSMIVIPCAFAIFLILNSYVHSPLAKLDMAIDATLATGDFTKTDYVSSNAFGLLATKFNLMLDTLRVQHENLQKEQRLRALESEITSDVLYERDMIIIYRSEDGTIRSNFERFGTAQYPLIKTLRDEPIFDPDKLGDHFASHPEHCKNHTVLMPALKTRRSATMQYLVELPNGEHWTVSIVRYKGKFDALMFSNHTTIYLAEREKAQMQKLEALGSLTSGVAHDFNNLLGIIIGATEIELSTRNTIEADNIKLIGQAAERARAIVNHLLSFSRKKPLERDTIELDTFLSEAGILFKPLLMADIELVVQCEKGTAIFANKDQLHVVLMNFAVNARHAMPSGGTLTIDARICGTDERISEGLPDHEFAVISITDTGMGMPKDIVERIFEPFFTTKANGKGTGLGLSMAYGFAQESGGKLACSSTLGEGTTMKLYLPLTKAKKAIKQKVKKKKTSLKGLSVCLFDDEVALLKITKRALELNGAHVTAFQSLSDFENEYAKTPFSFDLVITDNIMIDCRSSDVVKAVTDRIGPKPIIVASGLRDNEIENMLKAQEITGFLQKPFSISDMLNAVSECSIEPKPKDHTLTN